MGCVEINCVWPLALVKLYMFDKNAIHLFMSARDCKFHKLLITIHMPQRTSKILLVRLTANKNAFLLQIRITSFTRYTVWFGVTRSDQNTVNDYFTLSTTTYFDWFPLHTWMEASFGVNFTHGVYQNVTGFQFSLITYAQWSQSAISDYTVHHSPWWIRCTVWLEYGSLSFYGKHSLHLMIKFHFCGICIVMLLLVDLFAWVKNQRTIFEVYNHFKL